MKWQQIKEKALEINELQQAILAKSKNYLMNEIKIRNERYCNDKEINLRSLNNAILEHKIEITPYQIIIINKINALNLDLNYESIYENMPKTEELAGRYILELEKTYELINKSFDLIIDIEKLSEIEYKPDNDYENTEYANKVITGDRLFQDTYESLLSMSSVEFVNTFINEYKKYMDSLNLERKTELFLETFTLSYDKYSFEYFNEVSLIQKIGSKRNNKLKQLSLLSLMYSRHKNSWLLAELVNYENISLQELYDNFKLIYNTEFFKQKINKK